MNNTISTDGAPVITLGGKEFPIPLLAARQNMVIDPIVIAMTDAWTLVASDNKAGMAMIAKNHYQDLIEICFLAVTRAHPTMKREEFLDMPIHLDELILAFPVIAKQTGIFTQAPQKKALVEGEAKAGALPTGNAS